MEILHRGPTQCRADYSVIGDDSYRPVDSCTTGAFLLGIQCATVRGQGLTFGGAYLTVCWRKGPC